LGPFLSWLPLLVFFQNSGVGLPFSSFLSFFILHSFAHSFIHSALTPLLRSLSFPLPVSIVVMRPTYLGSLSLSCVLVLVLASSTSALEAEADGQVPFVERVDPALISKHSSTEDGSPSWTLPCSLQKGKKGTRGQGVRSCYSSYNSQLPIRDEHRVGPLPWEAGQEPIEESYAGHFPIRTWKQNGYHGETGMYVSSAQGRASEKERERERERGPRRGGNAIGR